MHRPRVHYPIPVKAHVVRYRVGKMFCSYSLCYNLRSLRPKKNFTLLTQFSFGDQIKEGRILEGKLVSGRMTVQLNDYPGSGANNRHTPRAQSGRVCIDC